MDAGKWCKDGWSVEGDGAMDRWTMEEWVQIMAKPNVWRADIHLTDRITVRLTFRRLITGAGDSLTLFLPWRLCLFLSFTTKGDFEGLRVGWIPVLIRHTFAQLIDQPTCPLFALFTQSLHLSTLQHPNFSPLFVPFQHASWQNFWLWISGRNNKRACIRCAIFIMIHIADINSHSSQRCDHIHTSSLTHINHQFETLCRHTAAS